MSHCASTPHQMLKAARARQAFVDYLGVAAATQRAIAIAALPTVDWKGRTLKTIRCCGTTGKGPHDCNVPEATLWMLITLSPFYCIYHPRDGQNLDARDRAARTSPDHEGGR